MIDLNDPSSLRFKRAQAVFVPDWAEGVELVQLVRAIGIRPARWIFGWHTAHVHAYDLLAKHIGPTEPLVYGPDFGITVLRAMQRGGWKTGVIPKVTRDVFRVMHHEGKTYAQIGKLFGVKAEAVRHALRRPRARVKPVLHGLAFG